MELDKFQIFWVIFLFSYDDYGWPWNDSFILCKMELLCVGCGKFQLVRKISVLGLLIRALLWLVVELLFG